MNFHKLIISYLCNALKSSTKYEFIYIYMDFDNSDSYLYIKLYILSFKEYIIWQNSIKRDFLGALIK